MKSKKIIIVIAMLVLAFAMAFSLVACVDDNNDNDEDDSTVINPPTKTLLTLECDPTQGTVTGGGEYEIGSSITVNATPNDGYIFKGWYKGLDLFADQPTFTFRIGTKHETYTAKFGKLNSVQLDYDNTQGVVSGVGDYEIGSSVTLSAAPYNGYVFLGWYEDDTLISPELNHTFIMNDKSINYSAKFDKILGLEKFDYSILDDGSYVINNLKEKYKFTKEIEIPKYISEIGDNAFNNNQYLTKVTLGNDVIRIGKSAFYNCDNLTSITIPEKTTYIDLYALNSCDNLTEIRYNGTLSQWLNLKGNYQIMHADIYRKLYINDKEISGNLVIPNDINHISASAFKGCSSITSVTIPSSVVSIGNDAFMGCDLISEVRFNGTLEQWLAIKWKNSLMNCGLDKNLYINGKELVGNIIIPNGVTGINNFSFKGCTKITSVTLPEGVISIEENAFSDCSSLTSINIPNSVTSIESYAFDFCTSLSNITLPDSLTNIGNFAFAGCSNLEKIVIPNKVTKINSYTFNNCYRLSSITIPTSVIDISDNAFLGCYALAEIYNLSPLTMTKGSSDYGGIALYALDVYTSLDASSKITVKDDMVLHTDNGIITLVKYTGSADRVTIPDDVTNISTLAFSDLNNLMSVTIGSGVKNIADNAFTRCYSLAEIYNLSTLKFFAGDSSHGLIAYYAHDIYTSLSETSKLTVENDMILHTNGNQVTLISYLGNATSVVIPNKVTRIGNNAFRDCSKLTSISIPNSVTVIGENAFMNCSNITNITIPNSVTDIGSFAFSGCSNLTSIVIPNGITTIKMDTFSRCKKLTTVTLPEGIISIGSYAFASCTSLVSITIPDSVKSIEMFAFADCTSLTNITLPEGIISIGSYAFFNCSSLTSITIPNSVTNIEYYAFYDCTNLTRIIFENTSGWFISDSYNAESGVEISVNDPSINATNFTTNYYKFYWKRV